MRPLPYPSRHEVRALADALSSRPLIRGEVRLSALDVRRVDAIRLRFLVRRAGFFDEREAA